MVIMASLPFYASQQEFGSYAFLMLLCQCLAFVRVIFYHARTVFVSVFIGTKLKKKCC